MTLRIQKEARDEIADAFDFYSLETRGLGLEFIDEVKRAFHQIMSNPLAWSKLSENTRKCVIHRFPFVIIYSYDNDEILVHAVAHFKRKPDYWKNRIK